MFDSTHHLKQNNKNTLLRPVWVFVLFCLRQKFLSSPCLPHQWVDCLHQREPLKFGEKAPCILMRSTFIFRPRCSHPHTFQRQVWLYTWISSPLTFLSHPNQKRGAAPSGLSELDWAQTYSYRGPGAASLPHSPRGAIHNTLIWGIHCSIGQGSDYLSLNLSFTAQKEH